MTSKKRKSSGGGGGGDLKRVSDPSGSIPPPLPPQFS